MISVTRRLEFDAGQQVEIRPLGIGKAKCANQTGKHVTRRVRGPGLFETRVVVGRDERQMRDLVAPQTRGAPPLPDRQTDVRRPDPLAPATQERAQLSLVHAAILRATAERSQVPLIPG